MSTTESGASARSSGAVTTHELIRTRVESWLREEARLPQTAIQVDTPLLELGIDSLGVAEISDDLARQTGKRVNPEVLFELENISQIAQYLDSLPVISTNGGGATAEVNGAMANVATATDSSISTDAAAPTDSTAPANGPPVAADPREHFELLNRRERGDGECRDGNRLIHPDRRCRSDQLRGTGQRATGCGGSARALRIA